MSGRTSGKMEMLTGQRWKAAVLFFGLLLGGIGAVWLALGGLIRAARGLLTRAPLLELATMDIRALFAGLAMLVFAAMMLLPIPEWARGGPHRRRRKGEPVPRDWAGLFMGAAVMCVLLCGLAPLVGALAMEEVAKEHGYRLCMPPADERRPPMRWARARPQDRCPRSRQDAAAMLR